MAGLIGSSFGATPIAWTPTYTAAVGSFTTVTTNSSIAYRWSRWVFISVDYTITTNGTAAGDIRLALPVAGASAFTVLPGRSANDGRLLQCHVSAGSTCFIVYASNLAYAGGTGQQHQLSGMYEV